MKQHLFEHPTGVFLHVEYMPATGVSKPIINDVRIAGEGYEPIGPNLSLFLHTLHTIDSTGPVTMATPVLELISQEIQNEH